MPENAHTKLQPPLPGDNTGEVKMTVITPEQWKADVVKKPEPCLSDNLKKLLATREKLKKLKSRDIRFTEAVLWQGPHSIIFPHTINVIQGQAGVHKSRLAENICAAFLKQLDCTNHLLGYTHNYFTPAHTVLYVDTERNLSEQFPYALQSIQVMAGYTKAEHPSNFDYLSLLEIDRKERFATLQEYINNSIKTGADNPLFIVLDVSTDCIEDFNKTDKSMELIDLMNRVINTYNVIFLCLIHENPKTDKARGHFGTELMNKASTVMQVGFEKDANQNDTPIIRVKYLKCRSTARHEPFYMRYSDEAKGLVLADASEIAAMVDGRKHKAGNEQVIERLETYLGDGESIARLELLDRLCTDLDASQRTMETRLTEIVRMDGGLTNDKDEPCRLTKETTKDKAVYYKLIPNEE